MIFKKSAQRTLACSGIIIIEVRGSWFRGDRRKLWQGDRVILHPRSHVPPANVICDAPRRRSRPKQGRSFPGSMRQRAHGDGGRAGGGREADDRSGAGLVTSLEARIGISGGVPDCEAAGSEVDSSLLKQRSLIRSQHAGVAVTRSVWFRGIGPFLLMIGGWPGTPTTLRAVRGGLSGAFRSAL